MYCFGENIFVIEETFCALFLKMFCAFKKTFGIFPKKDFFVLQNNISCKSGNIFCINKDRFYVFKETVGAFFEEKFCGFFRETICELQKGFVYFGQHFLNLSATVVCRIFKEKYKELRVKKNCKKLIKHGFHYGNFVT